MRHGREAHFQSELLGRADCYPRGMLSFTLLSLLALSTGSNETDWPAWRGPAGNGVATTGAPLRWDAETNVKWRTPLPRPANGSPIVSGDSVFLTLAEDEEGKRRSLYAFARADGALRWVRTVEHDEVMPTHSTNPYGGSTPASDGERVFVWHASAGLHAYDHAGEALWEQELGTFRHVWGYGTSPVVHEGRVFLNTGPGENQFLAAFDAASGEELWRQVEPETRSAEELESGRYAASWSSPLIVPGAERTLVVCGMPDRVVAYDAQDGELVWSCAGVRGTRGDLTYSTPVVAGDVCVAIGGWEGPILGVRLGGEGEVTDSHRLWRHPDQMSNCASGVFADGHVFVPDMGGTLWCIEPESGELLWRKRAGRGGTWSSPVLVGERIYLTDQNGTTRVFRASAADWEQLAENALGEETNATPAVAGGELFLRTHEALWCIAED